MTLADLPPTVAESLDCDWAVRLIHATPPRIELDLRVFGDGFPVRVGRWVHRCGTDLAALVQGYFARQVPWWVIAEWLDEFAVHLIGFPKEVRHVAGECWRRQGEASESRQPVRA